MAARIACGSAMRPGPYSPQAISPSSGPTKRMPSARSVARFRCVAGCCHMRTFMAGAASTVLSVASRTVEARSSARPMRHLGEKIGGRRRHDDEIGLARETDMADLGLILEVEELGEGPLLGEHRERKRRDERGAAARQDGAHRAPRSFKPAHEIEALIGGDAAADDQEDALAVARPFTPLVMPAQAGIQQPPSLSGTSLSGYWIARSSRAMTVR